jgi:hypothetical protein
MVDLGDRVRVSIPLRRSWFQALVATFAAGAWLLTGFKVIGALFVDATASPGSRVAALITWSLVTIPFVGSCLLAVVGRQLVDVNDSSITIRKALAGIGLPRKYAADRIANLRVVDLSDPHEISGLSEKELAKGMAGGPLAFDYGTRTVHFGPGLLDVEAGQILAELLGRFPRYRVPERRLEGLPEAGSLAG